jgi:hypothetical protein
MDRNDTIEYICNLGLVEGYLRKLIYHDDMQDYDDYRQELYLQICEVPEEKWDRLWKQGTATDGAKAIRGYVSGLIYRNVRSKNSKIYNRLKKFKIKEIPTDFSGSVHEEKENLRNDND